MQKSKIGTISIMIIIIIYTILRVTILSKLGTIYTYVINPLFWITLAFILYKLFGRTFESKKIKKQVLEYTLIACLGYIILYLISGLFLTFGKNPYATTIKGLIINIWILGIPVFFREYIRYKIINNVYDRDKRKVAIATIVLFTLIESELWNLIGKEITVYLLFMQVFEQIMPILTKNILYSYLSYKLNCSAAILYELITKLYLWISPILPNSPWVMNSIIDITIPVILFVYIRYANSKINRFRTREKILSLHPQNIVPFIIVIVVAIWFSIGLFPIKPVAIASGSMEKELNIGDVVIIKKCTPQEVNVGDIIEYKAEGYTIIHRVIEKTQRDGIFYFRTKGDNNELQDKDEVDEGQLIGKIIFKIKYLGYPSVLINKINKGNQELQEVTNIYTE